MPASLVRSNSKSRQVASARWTSRSFRRPAVIRKVTPSDLPTPSARERRRSLEQDPAGPGKLDVELLERHARAIAPGAMEQESLPAVLVSQGLASQAGRLVKGSLPAPRELALGLTAIRHADPVEAQVVELEQSRVRSDQEGILPGRLEHGQGRDERQQRMTHGKSLSSEFGGVSG